MNTIKQYFGFSFNGNRNFGEIFQINEIFPVNFPKEYPDGYGIAIRNNIDIIFKTGIKTIDFVLNNSSRENIHITVEFKTVASGNVPAATKKVTLIPENELFMLEIPDLLSELKEIVLFIPKDENIGLVADLKLTSVTLY